MLIGDYFVTYFTVVSDDDRVCKARADPTRRRLLDLLFEREGRTLTELEAESGVAMTGSGIMKHLRVPPPRLPRPRRSTGCTSRPPRSDLAGHQFAGLDPEVWVSMSDRVRPAARWRLRCARHAADARDGCGRRGHRRLGTRGRPASSPGPDLPVPVLARADRRGLHPRDLRARARERRHEPTHRRPPARRCTDHGRHGRRWRRQGDRRRWRVGLDPQRSRDGRGVSTTRTGSVCSSTRCGPGRPSSPAPAGRRCRCRSNWDRRGSPRPARRRC